MSVTESERATLRTALTEEIGEDSADILMRSTLPQGPDRLATKDDLDTLSTQVEGEFAKVQGEFANLHAKVDGGFAKMQGAMSQLGANVAEQVARESRRTMIAIAVAVMTIWVTMLVAFVTLISVLPETPAQPPPPPAALHDPAAVQRLAP